MRRYVGHHESQRGPTRAQTDARWRALGWSQKGAELAEPRPDMRRQEGLWGAPKNGPTRPHAKPKQASYSSKKAQTKPPTKPNQGPHKAHTMHKTWPWECIKGPDKAPQKAHTRPTRGTKRGHEGTEKCPSKPYTKPPRGLNKTPKRALTHPEGPKTSTTQSPHNAKARHQHGP